MHFMNMILLAFFILYLKHIKYFILLKNVNIFPSLNKFYNNCNKPIYITIKISLIIKKE